MLWEGACGAPRMVPHKLMAQRTSQFTQLGALPRAGGPGLYEDLRAPPMAGLVRFGRIVTPYTTAPKPPARSPMHPVWHHNQATMQPVSHR